MRDRRALVLFGFFLLIVSLSLHAYDFSQATVEKLQNGLTVMILEDHTLPLVSTQMLYKAGARNECVGSTGVAHFVEHMAFRATKNFPDTDVVSRIYAIGGEWHGYTWIDETTYFETVPVEYLDLILQIQADRMVNVLNREEEIEVERGSLITELHSYENDPAGVLNDAVMAVSFLQHPYRYNTVGWISDLEKITQKDVVEFYKRFYNPSNAVLAIAGDVNTADVLARVHRYFDAIPPGDSASLPRTVEPPQNGERRVTLNGTGMLNHFLIAYRAPSVGNPDFPIFVLLQQVLGGSGGVNFKQLEFADQVRAGTRLQGIGDDIFTFFVPTADPYIFHISGQIDRSVDPLEIESEIESRISEVRENGIPQEELNRALKHVLTELVFDTESTEDAAHQMAYFEGIGAFGVLKKLPELLESVATEDVRRAAQKYLRPEQRSIGWYLANGARTAMEYERRTLAARKTATVSGPRVKVFRNGVVVIVQRVRRAPTAFLRVLVPSNMVDAETEYAADSPVWRHTSFHWRFLREDFQQTLAEARKVFDGGLKRVTPDPAVMDDPEPLLYQTLQEMLSAGQNPEATAPVVVSMVGDIDEKEALSLLEKSFGMIKASKRSGMPPLQIKEAEKTVRIPGKAQSRLGYAVPAPPPSDPESYAFRILLYMMSHDYEGRLGKELIARKGLIYYISNSYNSDGRISWISLTMGVDPNKLQQTRAEFLRLLNELTENPPTEKELQEAQSHLIGRRLTAHQSNEELTAFYTQEWIEQGHLLSKAEFEKRIRSVTLKQVLNIIPEFLKGVVAVVDTAVGL